MYEIIYPDPPWNYKVWSKKGQGRSAEHHYPTMTTAQICALPVADLAAPNCTLFIWGTWPTLKSTLQVIDAWGFEYKTCGFLWVKLTKNLFHVHMGMGHWTRANTEFCLLATRGGPKRVSKSVRQLVMSPIRKHSQKPEEVAHRIVDLLGDRPRLEMFARRPNPGWDVWGNEVDGVSLPQLEKVA